MPLIPHEALPYFENAIYLPMLICILERDREAIEKGLFKLKSPYVHLIEEALKTVRVELKVTNTYLKRNNMMTIKGKNDGKFTEYKLIHGGYEDKRRYLNVRLRNRTRELISAFFALTLQKSGG